MKTTIEEAKTLLAQLHRDTLKAHEIYTRTPDGSSVEGEWLMLARMLSDLTRGFRVATRHLEHAEEEAAE